MSDNPTSTISNLQALLWGCVGIFCIMVIIGGFIQLVESGCNLVSGTSTSSSSSYDTVHSSAWDGSVSQVKSWISNNAKDPSSVQYIEWSPVTKTKDGYMVRCKFRAKNSFGGYVINNKIFTLSSSGTVLSVVGG